MDDLEAIQRLKAGDIRGLEVLVTRYQLKAQRVAFLVTYDESLSEDVVQDTFIHLYHHIRRFDSSRPFEPYLLRSVVNAALNATQKANRHISLEDNLVDVDGLLAQAASVESDVEYSQLKGQIIVALAGLKPRERAAVIQRYYLEMSEKEMAVALNTRPGTVKWILNTARAKLRDLLSSERSSE